MVVQSASVGPMRIEAWPALAQTLSVMTPENVCGRGAADSVVSAASEVIVKRQATRDRTLLSCANGESPAGAHRRTYEAPSRPAGESLLAWRHQVRGGRAGVHDPDPALARVVRQPHRLCRGARHRD